MPHHSLVSHEDSSLLKLVHYIQCTSRTELARVSEKWMSVSVRRPLCNVSVWHSLHGQPGARGDGTPARPDDDDDDDNDVHDIDSSGGPKK